MQANKQFRYVWSETTKAEKVGYVACPPKETLIATNHFLVKLQEIWNSNTFNVATC